VGGIFILRACLPIGRGDEPIMKDYQGKEARPKDVRITLKEVVQLKGLDSKVVADQTTANASEFFQIRLNP